MFYHVRISTILLRVTFFSHFFANIFVSLKKLDILTLIQIFLCVCTETCVYFCRSLENQVSELDLQSMEEERAERSLFVQELVLSTLAEGNGEDYEEVSSSTPSAVLEQARASPPAPPQVSPLPFVNRAAQNHPITHNPSSNPPAVAIPPQQQQQQQQQKRSSNSRGSSVNKQAIPSGSSAPIMRAPVVPQQPIRVVTGTGTIREVAPQPPQSAMGVVPRNAPGGGAGSGGVRGSSPPSNATRRKPTRPIEGRNQATEPPPPH